MISHDFIVSYNYVVVNKHDNAIHRNVNGCPQSEEDMRMMKTKPELNLGTIGRWA